MANKTSRVTIATVASERHWMEQDGIESSAIPGSQCSCGGQSSNSGGWSAAGQQTKRSS